MYEFSSYPGSLGTGYQVQFGGEFAGFSADAWYFKKYNAISVSALSAAQVSEVVANCNKVSPPTPPATVPTTVPCYSLNTAVAGTNSDNKTYMVSALWNLAPVPLKLYAGYEHIAFDNPTNELAVGTTIIGGYQLAVVNNTPYNNEKTLQVFWGGAKWSLTQDFDITVAYYGYKLNSFATGAHAGCTDASNSGCSGNLNAASLLLDYRLTKRFDICGGTFWNEVVNGLANGYYARNNIATTLGARFKF